MTAPSFVMLKLLRHNMQPPVIILKQVQDNESTNA
jgi:hypothetical protein